MTPMPRTSTPCDLFADLPSPVVLPEGVMLRPSLMHAEMQRDLAAAVTTLAMKAPFRRPQTRGQGTFSAAITNCGDVGWWSDRHGYRYIPTQPDGGPPWPKMPEIFQKALKIAVTGSPWPDFAPDACLINFYGPGAKMGLHQDKDERDFSQPIVTISLGDRADFMVGGPNRTDRAQVFPFHSGDVLVMGGAGRTLFHGVRRVHPDTSPIAGVTGRTSLTFRKAL